MEKSGRVDIFRFYGLALIQLLIEPGVFFAALPVKHTLGGTLGFLGLSSGFYAGAGLLTGAAPGSPAAMALTSFARFLGASGMMLIGGAIGYSAMVMICGKKAGFSLVFGIYVYASGITLLLAWLPFMLWFTEPWKYWLVWSGFKNGCGLSGKRALAVLAVSLPLQWCLILSALGAVMP